MFCVFLRGGADFFGVLWGFPGVFNTWPQWHQRVPACRRGGLTALVGRRPCVGRWRFAAKRGRGRVGWCKHASDHAATVGTKAWRYLLVPHDEITESKRFTDFLRFEVKV
jgi:hypothetical protein